MELRVHATIQSRFYSACRSLPCVWKLYSEQALAYFEGLPDFVYLLAIPETTLSSWQVTGWESMLAGKCPSRVALRE